MEETVRGERGEHKRGRGRERAGRRREEGGEKKNDREGTEIKK